MSNTINRCAFGLHALSNNDLIMAIQRIESQLEQPLFANITPTPAEVKEVLDKFMELQQQCAACNRQLIRYRDSLREELLNLLRMQYNGVNYMAQGNLEILAQSGFPIRKRPQSAQLPPQARIKKVKIGDNRGSFKVSLLPWKGRKFYELEVTGENGATRTYQNSKSRFVLNEFAPGERIVIAARIFNSADYGPWSLELPYIVPAYSAVVTPPPTGDDHKDMKVA